MVMPLKLMPLDRKITKEEAKASDQPMLKKGALRKGLTKAGQKLKPNRWQTTQVIQWPPLNPMLWDIG
jgi:hypothetical protein